MMWLLYMMLCLVVLLEISGNEVRSFLQRERVGEITVKFGVKEKKLGVRERERANDCVQLNFNRIYKNLSYYWE